MGAGDLEESSEHVLGVAIGERYLEQAFVDDPDSPVVEVSPYHEVEVDDETRRLDIAGLNGAGTPVVAVEVERLNHDYRRAVLEDYDKMAACDVEGAIWIVMNRGDAHELVATLHDPIEGPSRVPKTYSQNTPPQNFTIETPGLTAVHSITRLRDSFLGPPELA